MSQLLFVCIKTWQHTHCAARHGVFAQPWTLALSNETYSKWYNTIGNNINNSNKVATLVYCQSHRKIIIEKCCSNNKVANTSTASYSAVWSSGKQQQQQWKKNNGDNYHALQFDRVIQCFYRSLLFCWLLCFFFRFFLSSMLHARTTRLTDSPLARILINIYSLEH